MSFQWIVIFFSSVWALVVFINAALIMPLEKNEQQFSQTHDISMGAYCLNDRYYRGEATLFDIDMYFGV